jgi:hypothetical protein
MSDGGCFSAAKHLNNRWRKVFMADGKHTS